MALTDRQTRQLTEMTTEIAQLEHRLGYSNALGDNSSGGGITSGFANNIQWQSRLNLLRRRRDQLEAMRDGECLPRSANVGILGYGE